MDKKMKFLDREKKQSHYDKRLILEVVKLIEEGMPRKEVNRMYQLGPSTLNTWMRKYGSSTYQSGKRRSFSPLEKSKILAEIEQGRLTMSEAQKKYKISSEGTIRSWLYKSKQENPTFCQLMNKSMGEGNQKASSDTGEIQSLQKALEEANLKIKALNTMIDIAEEQLKIDIRKKSGTKQSGR